MNELRIYVFYVHAPGVGIGIQVAHFFDTPDAYELTIIQTLNEWITVNFEQWGYQCTARIDPRMPDDHLDMALAASTRFFDLRGAADNVNPTLN